MVQVREDIQMESKVRDFSIRLKIFRITPFLIDFRSSFLEHKQNTKRDCDSRLVRKDWQKPNQEHTDLIKIIAKLKIEKEEMRNGLW